MSILSKKDINEILEPNLQLDCREVKQLNELVSLLEPFAEATDLTQGENITTISMVLPCVLSLYKHLTESKMNYLEVLRRELLKSLTERFGGLLRLVGFQSNASLPPMDDKLYLITALLDPKFNIRFIKHTAPVSEEIKDCTISEIKSYILQNIDIDMAGDDPEVASVEPPRKKTCSKLFPYVSFDEEETANSELSTPAVQLDKYLLQCHAGVPEQDPIEFWMKSEYTKIKKYALGMLSVPASSAPVERVFSTGGIIARPHRSSISSLNLAKTIFLNYNRKHN